MFISRLTDRVDQISRVPRPIADTFISPRQRLIELEVQNAVVWAHASRARTTRVTPALLDIHTVDFAVGAGPENAITAGFAVSFHIIFKAGNEILQIKNGRRRNDAIS